MTRHVALCGFFVEALDVSYCSDRKLRCYNARTTLLFLGSTRMKMKNVTLFIMLAALTGVVAMDATTAQAKVRAREAAKAAAVTSTPETTEARQDAHQENQGTRKDRRDDASSTEKATAVNVAKNRQTKKANAAASVSANRNK